jgi:hypothetical protein
MRTLRIGLPVIVLLLFVVLALLLRPWHCPVNRTSCAQIETGMTWAEVEAVLGGPPGDYTTRPGGFVTAVLNSASLGPRDSWHGDECVAHVTFEDGRVLRVHVVEVTPSDTGAADLLEWRLARLKERLFP